MDAERAQTLFKDAESLYAQERFEQALTALDKLDATYPNTKNIMYPKARCLRRLGRLEEAGILCEQLIDQFNDLRALELQQRITNDALQPMQAGDATGVNDTQAGLFNPAEFQIEPPEPSTSGMAPPPLPPHLRAQESSPSKLPWIIAAVCVICIICLSVIAWFLTTGTN